MKNTTTTINTTTATKLVATTLNLRPVKPCPYAQQNCNKYDYALSNAKQPTKKQLINSGIWCNVVVKGNPKLKNNDTTRFIIWNLPAIKSCPFATNHCKKYCYAIKNERRYKNIKDSRAANFEKSKSDSFASDMIATLEYLRNSDGYKDKKQIIVRIHESGDFYNKAYALKWLEIAKHFENIDNRLIFQAYTKSILYFIDVDIPVNFAIRASVWDDTKPELYKMSYEKFNIYTALTPAEMSKCNRNFTECRCSDCATCGKCWDNSIKELICKIH